MAETAEKKPPIVIDIADTLHNVPWETIWPEFYVRGRWFGFPDCCIKCFCTRVAAFKMGLPQGGTALGETGYIMCDACAAKPYEEVIAVINANRVCPKPFPQGD